MHKILMVIRREYLERVKKKSFWIGTAVFPLLMIVMFGIQFAVMFVTPAEQKNIAFVDATGRLLAATAQGLDDKLKDGRREFVLVPEPVRGSLDETRRSLEPKVVAGKLSGILTVAEDIDSKEAFRFYAKNVGNVMATERIEKALKNAVVGLRLEKSNLGLDRKTLDAIMKPIDLGTFQVSAGGESKKKGFLQTWLGTFAFVMVLYMSLLLYGIAVMRGILEEKSSRVMEVLLGSLTPDQLMTGKIVGIGLVGLTQMAIYVVTAGALRAYFAAQQVAADWTSALDAFSPFKLVGFVVFYVLGYFMYTALFAAIGAVCNSEQEAQNLTTPVTMCLVIPMLAAFFFVNNPDSTVAVVVSMIPIFTPMVMYMRISVLTPPLWQILLSIVLMLGAIWLLFKGTAKIFRIGVLMYGKRPTVPEILRWARS
ncbi:MAG: ABC transporter permease [Acidobacteriia bacterium]|nr:ABC transporter permease [Terriglobia bacterium]